MLLRPTYLRFFFIFPVVVSIVLHLKKKQNIFLDLLCMIYNLGGSATGIGMNQFNFCTSINNKSYYMYIFMMRVIMSTILTAGQVHQRQTAEKDNL